jgi:D-xylose transport system permease protein
MTTTTTEVTGAGTPDPEHHESTGDTLRTAFNDYLAKLRGGDVGALPAVLGFVALVILFSAMRPDTFATKLNWANLLNQSAAVTFIAMGLVFVLLLGEIDLSAGWTAGVSAAVLAVLITQQGQPWYVAVVASLVTGMVIGFAIGWLVSVLGIPSFVVTLAAFLALQGVMLAVIGTGGTIPVRDETILSIMNDNMSPVMGWVMWAVVVLGYALVVLLRIRSRRAAGLPQESVVLPLLRVSVLAVLLGVAVTLLNQERSVNPALQSLKGVPNIVPLAVAFVVVLTFVLGRTSFGRHVYAVGGNAEAARRSGINVTRVKIACFMIGSSMAAVGGILLASRDNSVSPSTGGAQTLLYAVGAAVIGGTSLFGGKGRVLDAIIGGLVVAVIANGLPLITQKSEVQFIITGLVLLLAAVVDALSRRRAAVTGR